jgi:hypothetical protein
VPECWNTDEQRPDGNWPEQRERKRIDKTYTRCTIIESDDLRNERTNKQTVNIFVDCLSHSEYNIATIQYIHIILPLRLLFIWSFLYSHIMRLLLFLKEKCYDFRGQRQATGKCSGQWASQNRRYSMNKITFQNCSNCTSVYHRGHCAKLGVDKMLQSFDLPALQSGGGRET